MIVLTKSCDGNHNYEMVLVILLHLALVRVFLVMMYVHEDGKYRIM